MRKSLVKYYIAHRVSPRGADLVKNEKGFFLVEALISIAVIAIIAVVFLSSLSSTSKVLFIADERETAMNLAQSQLEYIQQQDYADSYTAAAIPGEYAGYTVAPPTVQNLGDGNIQKISIIVSHHGREVLTSTGSTLEGYKVK